MLTALLCTAVMSTSAATPPDAPARERGFQLSLGWDASEVFTSFTQRPPKVAPHLLALAPTSPTVALAASIVATTTGLFTATAFIIILASNPFFPVVAGVIGVVSGVLLAAFGPSVGGLMNGEVLPSLLRAGLRFLAIFPLALLGGWGVFAWLGWLAHDVAISRYAPGRWVERRLVTREADTTSAVSLLPGDGSLFRVAF